MADCIFCRIVAGELPSSMGFGDQQCAAVMDIQPVNSGHVLVVPLRHAAYLSDLDALTAGHLMITAQRVAAALRVTRLRCDGVNRLLADGEAAGQEVFHAHVHVIPRYAGDGFGFRLRLEYASLPPREQLESVAAQIRAVFGRETAV